MRVHVQKHNEFAVFWRCWRFRGACWGPQTLMLGITNTCQHTVIQRVSAMRRTIEDVISVTCVRSPWRKTARIPTCWHVLAIPNMSVCVPQHAPRNRQHRQNTAKACAFASFAGIGVRRGTMLASQTSRVGICQHVPTRGNSCYFAPGRPTTGHRNDIFYRAPHCEKRVN